MENETTIYPIAANIPPTMTVSVNQGTFFANVQNGMETCLTWAASLGVITDLWVTIFTGMLLCGGVNTSTTGEKRKKLNEFLGFKDISH